MEVEKLLTWIRNRSPRDSKRHCLTSGSLSVFVTFSGGRFGPEGRCWTAHVNILLAPAKPIQGRLEYNVLWWYSDSELLIIGLHFEADSAFF